tara:strand:- start:75 stop:1022 length:948 start_codon:yes stop_codon:yes gene_type:complete
MLHKNKKKMNKVISIMGPTASGKTDLAIFLRKNFNIEIISVDSVMLYKEFNIGSAKPSIKTLRDFPHKMVDILEPYEKYSVAEFYKNLLVHINNAHYSNKTPLLVGGSMMYFKTFFSGGLSKLNHVSSDIRKKVSDMLDSNGLPYLYSYLKKIDSKSLEKIHFNDQYRIVRMLEIYFSNNKKPSDILKKCSENVQSFDNLNLSIMPIDRKILHINIEDRLNEMLDKGLMNEVLELKKNYLNLDLPAMSTIGYKQINQYLDGDIDINVMKNKMLFATRQLAKRQITWLRHLDATTVYTLTDYDNIKSRVSYFLEDT